MSIYKELSLERKQLQQEGLVPDWVITNSYQMFKDKYLSPGETIRSRALEIAKKAASYMPIYRDYWEYAFFDIIWKGHLVPSTPVQANMGKDSGCTVSCSGGYIGDSVYDFYNSQLEAALLSKNGFGTSGYLGDIRERGAPITNIKGGASGIVPVFRDFVQVARDISQGSQRRGAWAGYVPIEHGDFDELLTHIGKAPDDANVGWIIPQSFIDKLDSGDPEAHRRYRASLKLKMLTGKGYYFFKDKVNALNPQWYKDKGVVVEASNLC